MVKHFLSKNCQIKGTFKSAKKRNSEFIREFQVDLDNVDGCFAPSDPVSGSVVVRSSTFTRTTEQPMAGFPAYPPQVLELVSLKIRLFGSALLKTRLRGVQISGFFKCFFCQKVFNRELVYVYQEQELISKKPGSPRHVISDSDIDPERHLPSKSEIRIPFEVLFNNIFK
jgi:hypothetical protein